MVQIPTTAVGVVAGLQTESALPNPADARDGCQFILEGLVHQIGQNGRKVKNTNSQDERVEKLLIEQMRSGSSDAFAELVSMHSRQLFSISLKMLENHADAEDNVQNALWKAYENINRFEGRSRFSTWLVRIAINEALMRIRARGPECRALDALKPENGEGSLLDIRDGRADPERQYIAKELTARAFLGFPASLVNAFIRKAEGWTERELANEIGITLSTLKSRMFHARERMQEHLEAARAEPQCFKSRAPLWPS